MKILQICSYLYPALNYGGPAKMVYDLSKSLSKNNRVTIYTTDVWDKKRRIKNNEKLKNKNNFKVYYFKNIFNSLAYKLRFFTGFNMVVRFLKEYHRYDVVHIHDVFILPQLLIALICIFLKKPYFYNPHGILDSTRLEKKTLIKRLLLPISLFCLKNAKQVIAVSIKEKNDLNKIGLTNVSTVFNGVPKLTVKPTNKFNKYSNEMFTFLYIGKLHPQKGLAQALKALSLSDIKAQFLIAGPNDGEKENLQKIISQEKLKNVYFLGYVNDNEKKELYNIANVFLHPSLAEGFSISILEAMQEKLPVIISDGCNFPDVTKHKAGFIVNVKSLVKDLTNVFNQINKDKNILKKMANNSAELVENKYTVSCMANESISLYEKFI